MRAPLAEVSKVAAAACDKGQCSLGHFAAHTATHVIVAQNYPLKPQFELSHRLMAIVDDMDIREKIGATDPDLAV